MGERILRDEGHEVINGQRRSGGDAAAEGARRPDHWPISPCRGFGYELCDYIKNNGGRAGVSDAGAVEAVDESDRPGRADGVLKKPFEASLLLAAIGRIQRQIRGPRDRAIIRRICRQWRRSPRSVVVLDPEQVGAAVTVALDGALPFWWMKSARKCWLRLAGSGRQGQFRNAQSRAPDKYFPPPAISYLLTFYGARYRVSIQACPLLIFCRELSIF